MVDWNYFNKFEKVNDMYLPVSGEGETKATQIVTAVCKLVYKWYNDGDVFDNTRYLSGWANDLSSYANWLNKHAEKASRILHGVFGCYNGSDYEDLLKELTDVLFDEEYLAEQNKLEKVDTVYKCDGPFEFVEPCEEDEYDEEDDW